MSDGPKGVIANEQQIGGDHYKSPVQHWDIVAAFGIGYLEGNATKYVSRWRKKNGLQDLEKARHYIQKMFELAQTVNYRPSGIVPEPVVREFIEANGLTFTEGQICLHLFRWDSLSHLISAYNLIVEMEKEKKAQDEKPDETGQDHPFGFDEKEDVAE